MSRPVHFEIHAGEPDRAITFYTGLFDWKFDKWDGPMPYWLVTTGPDTERGINGGLLPRQSGAPEEMAAVNGWVCTVGVTALDAMITKAVALGGVIAVPKMPIPGMGWLAYAKDTEGNIFGMMETDPSAK